MKNVLISILFIGFITILYLILSTPVIEETRGEVNDIVSSATHPQSYNACIGCHGITGEKNSMAPESTPNSMTKAEIVRLLKGYKDGTINKYGKGLIMRGFASRLTDAQIDEIAVYLSK